jgi:hypothetical protein
MKTFVICFGAFFLFCAFLLKDKRPDPVPASAPAPAPAQLTQAERDKQWKERTFLQIAVMGAVDLKKSMRNPDSFKLARVLVMDDGSVCYDYRAQNGFGGMNAEHAVLADGEFESEDSAGFHRLWNKRCARKKGEDRTSEVTSVMRVVSPE